MKKSKPMKTPIIALLTLLVFLSSCNKYKKLDYLEFNKAYTNFIELATNEFGAKYGMAIAVVKNDRIIFEKYLGMADVDKNIKVSKNTLFYIASITKSFTAMAALRLEAKGKLDFNKSLAEFFPEIDFAPKLKADSITIPHLMIHTSGIENNPIGTVSAFTGFHDKEKLLAELAQFTVVNTNAPFGKFEYTNLGYIILGMIMERELGADWKSLVEQEVLQPLKMNHTSTRMSTALKQEWEIAKPYSQNNDENKLVRLFLEKKDNTMHAAGGMLSTAEDMARYMVVALNNGKIDGEQVIDSNLVKDSQLKHAKQNRIWYDLKRFGYGYGWNIATTPLGDKLVHHFGTFTGMHPQFSFVRETGIGVVIMANEGEISYDLNMLLSAYVFDYFSKRENLDNHYKDKLKKYYERYTKKRKSDTEYMIKVAKRTWKLELPFSSYTGTYTSDLFGTLLVEEVEENKLVVTIGNLKSNIATPHRTNAIRVVMGGNGSVVQFGVNDGKVEKAIWKGLTFTKMIH
ncbi:serine hydrolase domain-containing protein [uncultured Tenacibaculum sp.]|uniref:serine hydrolase domain-containing protein n=1 Tax=uncultured Tenacibaculum sp. TaxID=174713 RepID=UPI0026274C36|nr:serine hydrolase domain-containing protein [uncultured Tenacibaculum sp.]